MTAQPDPSVLPDDRRFRFDCTTVDGRTMQPLTSLDEVWASTDYLQIASCSVSPLSANLMLLPAEETAAELAVPGTRNPLAVVEGLLSICTRLPPASGVSVI